MLITKKRVIVVRYTDRYLERAVQKTMTVICALEEYVFFLKSRMVGSIAFPYGFLYSPERRTYFTLSMLR